jgi:hypothetical protein
VLDAADDGFDAGFALAGGGGGAAAAAAAAAADADLFESFDFVDADDSCEPFRFSCVRDNV